MIWVELTQNHRDLASLRCANAHLGTFEANLQASPFFKGVVGGRIVGRAIKTFGGRDLAEIAYGWNKLELTARTTPERSDCLNLSSYLALNL